MTNEITQGEALIGACRHVHPALICGDTIGGLVCWLILFITVALLLAIVSMRKSLVLEPTGILNPIASLRIAGFLLAMAGVAWIWEMYKSVVFAFYVLATDMTRESKESFLLGVFQTPRLLLAAITALLFSWALLMAIAKRLQKRK